LYGLLIEEVENIDLKRQTFDLLWFVSQVHIQAYIPWKVAIYTTRCWFTIALEID
jgi:hypothetical protein